MRPTKLSVLGLVVAAGLTLAGCEINTAGEGLNIGLSRGSATDTWTRSYPVAPGSRFELINVNGRITAEPADGTSLEVSGERTAKASSDEAAKELLGKIEMREETGDSRVRVEVRPPRLSGLSGQEVKWTIRVPKGVHVDLRTTNGGVRVTNLDGEIRAKSINGGVKGEGLNATSVEASTINGGVDIDLASLAADGNVELECVNGGVELRLPSDAKASISARAVNGGVKVDGLDLQSTDDQNTRRRLEGTMNGGGARVSASTTNGGVRLGASSRKPTT